MANKKISQLVAKTTIQSTDLFPIGDATTGTLYKKTIADLQAAIGGAVISVNGLVGTVVLDADDILETATPTNKYFTDARARAAISLTTTGSSGSATYSSSTGVLNVPTYTLAGLGGITATFLSGGTGITYNSGTGVISYSGTVYTDSSIRGLFSAGTGLSYNSTTGVFTNSITQYTDALARAAISATSPITYNSTTGVIGITGANLSEATSSVLTITGGTGALLSAASIQVKQASGSQSGFLSSTDWTTFNNKQNTITNPVTGTGTTNYLTKWTSSSAIGNSIIFDNGSVGINTTSPNSSTTLTLQESSSLSSAITFLNRNSTQRYSIAIDAAAVDDKIFAIIDNNASAVRFALTSTGNVGIGTTSPQANLQVLDVLKISNAAQSQGNLILGDGGSTSFNVGIARWNGATNAAGAGGLGYFAQGATNSGGHYFYTGDAVAGSTTERMRITTGGNVGIGTTSPTVVSGYTTLSVNNSSAGGIFETMSNGTAQGRFFGNTTTVGVGSTAAVPFIFTTSDTERMRLTTSANLLIGTTTDNGERLYVSGAIRATGTITANSDITLKKNLAKIENALEKVEQINGYTYEFKEDDSKRHAGVIAQEIQGVLPEIVNKGNDGILGVEYGNISALLIEAIKEQQAQINELKALLNK